MTEDVARQSGGAQDTPWKQRCEYIVNCRGKYPNNSTKWCYGCWEDAEQHLAVRLADSDARLGEAVRALRASDCFDGVPKAHCPRCIVLATDWAKAIHRGEIE